MIYRTYNVYENEENEEKEEKEECIICWENINNEKIIKLIKQTIYLKNCQCSAIIHNSCLKKWFSINKNCPICRKFMIKKYNYFLYIIKKIVLSMMLISMKVFYISVFLFLLYFTNKIVIYLDQYSDYNNDYYNYYNDYNYTNIYYVNDNDNEIIFLS